MEYILQPLTHKIKKRIGEVISYVNGAGQVQSRETKVVRGRRGFGFQDTLPCKETVYIARGLLNIL